MPKVRGGQLSIISDHWEIDLSDNVADVQLVVPVYCRSLQKQQLKEAIGTMDLSTLQDSVAQFVYFEPVNTATSAQNDLNIQC